MMFVTALILGLHKAGRINITQTHKGGTDVIIIVKTLTLKAIATIDSMANNSTARDTTSSLWRSSSSACMPH
jgi:hypothetical protein